MESPPTIRSLARAAGVSAATVSLALRNNPRISAAERTRLQRMAEEAGYRANPIMARLTAQLRSSRTATYQSTLAAVYTARRREEVELRTVQEWTRGCASRASRLGYRLDRFEFYTSDLTPERLVKILEARNILGVVAMGPCSIGPEFDVLWDHCATVVVGNRPRRPPLSYVANNQFSTCLQAMEEVLKLGYRRPALCVLPEIDDVVDRRFLGGFLVGQSGLPRGQHVPPFPFSASSQPAFAAWLKKWRPDVILTLQLEIKRWIKEIGLRVPDDVALVHLDHGSDLADWAGMQQNNEQVGMAAIDVLVGQLHRNEVGVPPFQKCMTISGVWAPGPTVRAAAAS